jgi:hypothetical protein
MIIIHDGQRSATKRSQHRCGGGGEEKEEESINMGALPIKAIVRSMQI